MKKGGGACSFQNAETRAFLLARRAELMAKQASLAAACRHIEEASVKMTRKDHRERPTVIQSIPCYSTPGTEMVFALLEEELHRPYLPYHPLTIPPLVC